MDPIILVHGGAGRIKDDKIAKVLVEGVKKAAKIGHNILAKGGSVLDAVEAAVKYMEDDENYNAGKGSVLTLEGEVEMDASIMLGADLSAGAVTVVKDIQHPISLARMVMEKTSHILLAGEGAKSFAVSQGIQILPEGALVTERTKNALTKYLASQEHKGDGHELGTVGAVAIDSSGRLAAATSTGGREGKLRGRSSDTCIIGSGTYADDNIGATSTTGHGETIAKFCLAHSVIKSMEGGKGANEATNDCVQLMTKRLNNTAGAVTLSSKGEVGIGFSTERMSWCYQKGDELHFGIDHEEHKIEKC
ncbi:isoaspartyl peptidase/L-asparaginase-like isoform X2 [Anoplophora glabripennis]|nr:isoaspartyl peptidase/L-asparaginase-like isoform X2 [Anoplophora glabripennis]XP_018570023.1 isoaspartyl peptidase/L-asparaginase-like isoform X2 [Anoplophora glabripennis]XP_018570024.1 isoaspartyl peptidase/L-asparaginase-like isoform X2 [Anoplophora glabripennis]